MKNLFADLLDLIYPNLCFICGETLLKSESHICLSCLNNIPRTNYHLLTDNPVEKRFWGKAPIYRGTSFFFFQKGSPFQKLLHELKYKGNKEIGEILGRYAAAELLNSPDFCSIDIIIPIPLHPKRFAQRGYNQSEWIGKGLSAVLDKPQDTNTLKRVKQTTTQTKKSVFERFENTEGIFELSGAKELEGKHLLLIDDVLTTGSTLNAAINTLLNIPNVKISIFTLAIA
jgi:ComF family protein